MKKTIIIITTLLLAILSLKSNAQCDVVPLGPDDKNQPSYYAANYSHSAVDNNDVIYVVYSDETVDNRITVRKYESELWTTVGTEGFSVGETKYNKIAIDNNNIPYVAFRDENNGGKATVMKFDGTNWVLVGAAGFSDGAIDFTSFAIDGNNALYFAYQDEGNDYKATVKKYDGTNWINVGNAGFTADTAKYISIAINGNDIPYIAFTDADNSNKATVLQFNGTNWINVGNAGFTAGIANYTSLAISNNDTVYIAFQDGANANKASVMKFNGSTWQILGNAGFSTNVAIKISLIIGNNETPYIGFYINSFSSPIILTFENNTWNDMNYQSLINFTSKDITVLFKNDKLHFSAQMTGYYEKVSVYSWSAVNLKWNMLGDFLGIANTFLTNGISLVVNNEGIPYITYRKVYTNSNILYIAKFVNNEWQILDSLVTGHNYMGSANMTIHNNEIYVVNYTTSSVMVKVYKLNASEKLVAHTPDIYISHSSHLKIAFDYNNDIVLLFQNYDSDKDIQFRKYKNSTWENIINLGVNEHFHDQHRIYINLAIDKNNNIYTAYCNKLMSKRASVVMYDGSNINYIGNTTISIDSVAFPYIAIDQNDTLYVAYSDLADDGKLYVYKYDGTDWNPVGNVAVSEGRAEDIVLHINEAGVPCVLYTDWGNGRKAILKHFNGTDWIGSEISADYSLTNYLTFNSSGTPFLLHAGPNPFAKMLDEYLAPDYAEQTQDLQYPYTAFFKDECEIITTLKTTNNNSVSGSTTAKVWVETTQPVDFVKRHYEINPTNNATSSNGRAIFYFKQSEFDDYNIVSTLKLPTHATDSIGIKNIAFVKYSGSSSNNSGLPNTYGNDSLILFPNVNDILWNSTSQRWEVSVDITGFGGFFLMALDTTLSVNNIFNDISEIILYPNPTEYVLNINLQNGSNLLHSQAVITTLLGTEVQSIYLSKTHNQIALDNLSSGIYFIRFVNGKVAKFVKQ